MTNRLIAASAAVFLLLSGSAFAIDLSNSPTNRPITTVETTSPGDAFTPPRPVISRQGSGPVAMTDDPWLLCKATGGRPHPVFNDDREIVDVLCIRYPRHH